MSGPNEIPSLQILVVRQKSSIPRELVKPFVVCVSIPKFMLASRLPHYHKYLLHISKSVSTCCPSYLLHNSKCLQLMGLPCYFGYALSFSSSLTPLLLLCSCLSLGQIQSTTGHVQSAAFSLCPGSSQMPLPVLYLISTLKTPP